ncbi:unnamed protein product, partial [Linum tenue]
LSQGLGSKQNRTYCPFYFKIIAFRHTKSSVSPTILLSNMYQRPNIINHVSAPRETLSIPAKSSSTSKYSSSFRHSIPFL